jgi:glycosyltransferase involved in cell wall biosynthesis
MKILIIPRTLGYGGAQRQTIALARELAGRGHDIYVMPFYGGGDLERELSGSRIRLLCVNKRSRWDLRIFWRLYQAMLRERFDAIYALGVGPNLAATLIRCCFPRVILFWSVRKSDATTQAHERPNDFGWLAPKAAHFSHRIVFNSRSGLRHGVQCGYPRSKVVCIPNGIDAESFYPDPVERAAVRKEWGIDPEQKLIGLVGRIDPVKSHENFFRAAALVTKERSDVRFACIGGGSATLKARLETLSRELQIEDKLHWIESRGEMRAVYNALDILCSASLSEGFPNAIGEALACACPCVVTDVGDCRFLVGDAGRVVPPGNPVALAQQLLAELSSNNGRNQDGRRRILENFDVFHLGNRFEQCLAQEIPGLVTASEVAR